MLVPTSGSLPRQRASVIVVMDLGRRSTGCGSGRDPPADVSHVLELLFVSPNRSVRDVDLGWGLHVKAALSGAVVDADVRIGLARSLLALDNLDEAQTAAAEAEVFLARGTGWRRDELVSLQHRLASGGARVAAGQLTSRTQIAAWAVSQGVAR